MANPVVLNSSAIVGKRDQLSDVIYNLDPFETPIVNSIGKGSTTRVTYDWQVDDFQNGDGDTASGKGTLVGEGHEFESQFGTFTDRLSAVCQINERGFGITGTAEVEKKAGRSSELAYQMAKVAKKFKMDMEMQIAGGHRDRRETESAGKPRSTGSISNWIHKHVVHCDTANASKYVQESTSDTVATGAVYFGENTGVCKGKGVWKENATAATAQIQEQDLQSLLTGIYMESGRSPNVLVVDPLTKTRISNTFVGRGHQAHVGGVAQSNINSNMTDRTVQAVVDVYVSDFGTLRIMPSRFIGGDMAKGGMALALDTSMWSIDYLRPFNTYDLPKTGDYVRKAMNAEWALRCNNEMSSGMIIDFAKGNPRKSEPVNPALTDNTVATPTTASAGLPANSHNKVPAAAKPTKSAK